MMRTIFKQFTLCVIYGILTAAILLSPIQLSAKVNAQETGPQCWAVIVGIANYQTLSNLSYADDDARDIAAQLSPIWGDDHVKLLTDSMATKQGIEDAITNWLATREKAGDVVLFFWSGRGSATLDYIFPYDSLTATYNNDISANDLNNWFGYLDTNKIVIMNIGPSFLNALSGTSRIIMAPAASNEDVWEVGALGHSVFAYYILEALNNFTADNNNFELSAEEIFDYAKTETTDYTTSRTSITVQHPQISDNYQGDLNLLIKVTAGVEIELPFADNVLSIDGQAYSSTSLPKTFIWAAGSSHNFQATSPIYGKDGERFVFSSWNDGNTSSSRTISSGGTYTANYQRQYYLTVTSAYGNPQGDGWYDSGTTATISVTTPVEQNGTKHIFTGWSGDYSGNTASASVAMSEPKTVTANWKTQYYLTVTSVRGNPTGTGWYDSGAAATISVDALVEEPGTKHHFTGWIGDYSGDTTSSSVPMNQPKTVTANWRTEYLLTVQSEYGEPQGGGWYDSDSTATISVTTPVGVIVRQVFTGWSGDYTGDIESASIVMNQPKTVTASWTTDSLQLYIIIIVVVVIAIAGFSIWYIKNKGKGKGKGKEKKPVVEPVKVTPQPPPPQPTPQPAPPTSCHFCGAKINPGDDFCSNCGKPVKG